MEILAIRKLLAAHYEFLQDDVWTGLPELTNAHASFCRDSCRTQAWSIATLLDALYDMDCVARQL